MSELCTLCLGNLQCSCVQMYIFHTILIHVSYSQPYNYFEIWSDIANCAWGIAFQEWERSKGGDASGIVNQGLSGSSCHVTTACLDYIDPSLIQIHSNVTVTVLVCTNGTSTNGSSGTYWWQFGSSSGNGYSSILIELVAALTSLNHVSKYFGRE